MDESLPIPPRLPGAELIGTANGPSDEVLLQALLAGRGHAFDVLVARHGARVRSYLGTLLRDRFLAEDLTQEVFLRLLTQAQTREEGRSLVVWLLRVARNLALDHLRHARLHTRLVASVRNGIGRLVRRRPVQPDEALENSELHVALECGLAELPETQRSAFLLRERDGLSYEEIAIVMECLPKTVSTRLHRARIALREVLAEHLEEGA